MFSLTVVDHIMVAHSFRGAEFGPAQRLHGATFVVEAEFRAGRIQILSNVELFGEGLDVPGAEVGIFLRPTVSVALWRQQVQPGRGTCASPLRWLATMGVARFSSRPPSV